MGNDAVGWRYRNAFIIIIYTIILLKSVCLFVCLSVCLSMFANCMSQLLLDRLGRYLKLFVSTESISCHESASQFGPAFFWYPKNNQNYREYRVPRANVYLNEAASGHCSPVTYMSGDNSDHIGPSGVRLNQNGEMQQVKTGTMRDYSFYIFTA